MQDRTEIAAPAAKIVSAWAAVCLTSWADIASFLAAIYSALLISEWSWKRVLRPFATRKGWIKE